MRHVPSRTNPSGADQLSAPQVLEPLGRGSCNHLESWHIDNLCPSELDAILTTRAPELSRSTSVRSSFWYLITVCTRDSLIVLACLLTTSSCQAILGIDDLPSSADSGVPDAMTLDPFAGGTELTINAPGFNDDDPTLTPDMLEMYFNSARDGNGIYVSTRAALGFEWETPTRVTALDTVGSLGNPKISRDGLTL